VPALCRSLGTLPGFSVHLAARPTPSPVPIGKEEPFIVHWTDGSRTSTRRLIRELASDGAAILHCHGIWDPMYHAAARLARRKDIPMVYSIRGMLEPWALRHKRWKKRLGWMAYQRADLTRAALLHATSEAEVDSIRRCGFDDSQILTLPNAVPLPPDLAHLTAITQRTRTLLFLGRIHPVKGIPPLLEAWAAAAPAGWTLQLTGPDCDGHRAGLETVVRRAGLTGRVRFTGSVDGEEKWRLLAEAGCLVLTSYSENFGMVAAEALAVGTPVAASTGTPWQRLEDEDAGWWVPPTRDGWVAFLEDLSSRSMKSLEAMGERGRAFAAREFSSPSIALRFAGAYRSLLGDRFPPSSPPE